MTHHYHYMHDTIITTCMTQHWHYRHNTALSLQAWHSIIITGMTQHYHVYCVFDFAHLTQSPHCGSVSGMLKQDHSNIFLFLVNMVNNKTICHTNSIRSMRNLQTYMLIGPLSKNVCHLKWFYNVIQDKLLAIIRTIFYSNSLYWNTKT